MFDRLSFIKIVFELSPHRTRKLKHEQVPHTNTNLAQQTTKQLNNKNTANNKALASGVSSGKQRYLATLWTHNNSVQAAAQ